MKSYFISACLALSASLSPVFITPAAAQSYGDAQVEALQEMGAWMQDAMNIQNEMMSLFSADTMQEMYSVINSEDDAAIVQFGRDFAAKRETVLSRAASKMNALPKPEKWNIDAKFFSKTESAIYKAALTQYESMNDTFDEFSKMSGGMVDMLSNWESLEEEGLIQMQEIQITSAIKLVEMENRQIDSFLRAIEPSSPNYQFQKIVKQMNLASIPEVELSGNFDADVETRQEYGRRMRVELLPIKALISEGRRNTKTQVQSLESISSADLNIQEQALLPKLFEMYESFETTFDVESSLLDSLMGNANLYLSDRSDDDISPEIDENDLVYFRLMEERAALMNTRVSLIQ